MIPFLDPETRTAFARDRADELRRTRRASRPTRARPGADDRHRLSRAEPASLLALVASLLRAV